MSLFIIKEQIMENEYAFGKLELIKRMKYFLKPIKLNLVA